MSSAQQDPSASAIPQPASFSGPLQPHGLPAAPQAGGAGLPFTPPQRRRYRVRRNLLENRWLRLVALVLLLALCGVVILAMVQKQTGTVGFLVGLSLAVLPVPLILGAFYWLDRVEPKPVRLLLFCFAWGACAATLVAILANTWATDLLISHQVGGGETLGASLVAPLVEESAKGAAVALVFWRRRTYFTGLVDGAVFAGFTATGFAFTENILYIGRSITEVPGGEASTGVAATVVTFVLREVMSPFAHPLFTSMTAIGFGIAAMSRKRWQRICAPVAGWIFAMLMHGTWNSSPVLGAAGFFGVYFLFMVPVFALMVWLLVWARGNELRTVGRQLAVYVQAGWMGAPVPVVLSSMRTRKQARALARFQQGPAGDKAMREYQGFGTSLALLRERVARGLDVDYFAEREQELLHHLWERKEAVAPVFARVGEQELYRRNPLAASAWGRPAPAFGVPAYGRPPYPGPGPYPAPTGYVPPQSSPQRQPHPQQVPQQQPYPGQHGRPAWAPQQPAPAYRPPVQQQPAYPYAAIPQPQQPYTYPTTRPAAPDPTVEPDPELSAAPAAAAPAEPTRPMPPQAEAPQDGAETPRSGE